MESIIEYEEENDINVEFNDKYKYILELIKENSVDELCHYLHLNSINLSQLNNEKFDILIYAIENDSSIAMLNCILEQCHYKTLNYYILKNYSYYSPLALALVKNRFDVANVLLKNKADIHYRMFDCSIYQFLFNKNALNKHNLLYMLNNSISINWLQPKIPRLIEDCLYKRKNDLIQFIFYFFIFDVEFILNFLKIYKTRIPLSSHQLNEKLLKEKGKIVVLDNWYNLAFEKESYDIFNILLKNDLREQKIILKILLNSREYIDQLFFADNLNLFINKIKSGELHFDVDKNVLNVMMTAKEKRKKVVEIIDRNNTKELESYIDVNSISLVDLNGHHFDVLIYGIENHISFEMITYIVEQYSGTTLNYFIGGDFIKTPLSTAISHNQFDVADLLIKKGADINYCVFKGITSRDSIPCYLYENELINNSNLRYILNCNGLDKEYVINFINMLSKKKPYTPPEAFLEIIMKHYIFDHDFILHILYVYKHGIPLSREQLQHQITKEKSKVPVRDWWYKKALDKKNYRAFRILFEHDQRPSKYQILNKIFKLYDYYDRENGCEKSNAFIFNLKNSNINIPIESSYINGLSMLSKHRRNIVVFIYNDNIHGLELYLKENNISLYSFNSEGNYWRSEDGFDILIYAIENDASIPMLQFIINQYEHLNYFNCCYFNYKYDYDYHHDFKRYPYDSMLSNYYYVTEDDDSNYYFNNAYKIPMRTPLFSAITGKKESIINLLIENGADINYQINHRLDGDIVHLLYQFNHLSEENLKLILNHGYQTQDTIDHLEEELEREPSYLTNFNFIEIIFRHYLKEAKRRNNNVFIVKREWFRMALQHKIFNLLELFIKYDSRERTSVLDQLYDLYEENNHPQDSHTNSCSTSYGEIYLFVNMTKDEELKKEIENYLITKNNSLNKRKKKTNIHLTSTVEKLDTSKRKRKTNT
ncbi:hypothetical protein PIROE2DRAFT_14350 [Piromyces sp. E2]|nr:hypothetical protein PIROE2DRAFT_14350 [Piromyces sp. E2]|eukprot:OUM59974.1 hypothetical protein PIROE2DRAFT_14350 [Piromyces sp. E2]